MSLNDKQKRFVEEYLVDLNATQAAIRAGYSEKTARSQGQRLLTNVDIQAAIQEGQGKRSERTKITQDRVLKEFARIAFSDLRDSAKWSESGLELVPSDDLDDDVAAAIQEVSIRETEGERSSSKTVKVKHYDKIRALEFLAEHLGMVNRKVDLNLKIKDLPDEKLLELGEEALKTLRKTE